MDDKKIPDEEIYERTAERIIESGDLEPSLGGYSEEELFSKAKEYTKGEDYQEAKILFYKLSRDSKNQTLKRISYIYGFFNSAITYFDPFSIEERSPAHNPLILHSILGYLGQAMAMHQDRELSQEDLFAIDTLVDRLPFDEMIIPERPKFEDIYCRFKEYVTEVFIESRKK